MFRIRRLYEDVSPANIQTLREVQEILTEQFPLVPKQDVGEFPERARNPFWKGFKTALFVAENAKSRVLGFALLLYDPDLQFGFLDFLASAKKVTGRGVGAALYERVREEARALRAKGLFFECLPDDPQRSRIPEIRKSNAARLRFYEGYGARPIVNTQYETPVQPEYDDNVPHLIFDGLDHPERPLGADYLRQVVRAILERKYGHLCPPPYVDAVVASIQEDPVRLRDFRYLKTGAAPKQNVIDSLERIAVVINDKHDIHHIRERGYVEAPVRVKVIRGELEQSGLTEIVMPREYPLRHILAVHDADFVEYLRRACASLPPGKSVYPYVFPVRNARRPPRELTVRAGYYCIDTFTPINANAFPAAKRAVDCTLTAADEILEGRRLAYALVRPPGHHAERRAFGGFCYFNNAAVAANYLSRYGKVAIVDVDYHHGNGQQEIFYERSDVLTVSIHGDPEFAYPYFTGFADERGAGPGEGFNWNLPLPETQDGVHYHRALAKVLRVVAHFRPTYLVIALGLDPAKGDPTGTWLLNTRDFERNGQMFGELNLPTLVVQEGGYRTRTLGINARAFFKGLSERTNASLTGVARKAKSPQRSP